MSGRGAAQREWSLNSLLVGSCDWREPTPSTMPLQCSMLPPAHLSFQLPACCADAQAPLAALTLRLRFVTHTQALPEACWLDALAASCALASLLLVARALLLLALLTELNASAQKESTASCK
jgi:hypothetical protein